MNAIASIQLAEKLPVVAIPVSNEAHHIRLCLAALAAQSFRHQFEVLLLLNNCTDGTERVVEAIGHQCPFRLHVTQCELKPAQAHAGAARRLAMDLAATLTDGVLLTTDADSCVGQNWLAANIDAIDAGADAVAGRAEIDPVDAARLPARLLENEARAQLLVTLLDRIDCLIDPDPADPWPRHVQHSGASIAVRADCYRRAGGLPPIALGEDRAFFRQLRRIDARIRHAPEAIVTVSGRLVGRARGGMADTMRRRLEQSDAWLDECTERAADRANRAAARSLARTAWDARARGCLLTQLASNLQLPARTIRTLLQAETFGAAWDNLERRSPRLRHRLVPVSRLEAEIKLALEILDHISPVSPAGRLLSVEGSSPANPPFSANHRAASVNASSAAG